MNDKVKDALLIMGKGMLGIFIALTVIYLFVILLTKVFPGDSKVDTEKKRKRRNSHGSN